MSDYLSDEEQLARFRSWWKGNGTLFVLTAVVAIAAVVGWRWYQDTQQQQREITSDLYADYLDADGEAKSQLFERIAEEGKNGVYHAFVLLHEAKTAVTAEDYTTAEGYLQTAVTVAPDETVADLARLRLASVLQQLERSDEALALLTGVRSEGYRTQLAELKGDIHLARGERDKAFEAYAAAVDSLDEGDRRPVLEMKRNNTAPNDAS